MKRRLFARLLAVFLSLAQAAVPAWAQDAGSTGAGSAAAPAAGTTPGAPLQGPSITAPAVQTPTITNAPNPAQAPGGPQEQATQSAAEPTRQPTVVPDNTLERNEFQDFIVQSTGQRLPLFGYNLFAGAPSTFAPVENIPVTPDYVIGPGDQLIIRAWGQLDVDLRTAVDRNGMINIPKVGSIEVSGIRYQDITDVVHTAVSRNFRNFELLVTMGQLRSVQIFVVGNAKRPGSYTVSSLSTLTNAVFAAGGPSSRGSMRAIQLKRANRVVTTLDLYDLLISGDKSKDAKLLPGDVIYIAPVGPQVALVGSVNTPAIYELKGGTTVGQLLKLAGGLTATAQTKRASIERIANREARTTDLFTLDEAGFARSLHNGDLLTVFSISPKFESVVTLRGHVAAPLRYPYREGMRIRDLIPEKEALITPDYYLRRNLAVRIDVKSALDLRFGTQKNVLGEVNWDYAVIERLNRQDLRTQLIPFDLGKAILEGDPAQNLLLEPGDVVTIFSKSDINVPQSRQTRLVRLEGEFAHAGVYEAQPGETLRQIVVRAGGLMPEAYLFGAEFTRASTREQQTKAYQEALNRLERESQAQLAVSARSTTQPQDAVALGAQQAAQQALIARLRQLKPTGRIALEVPRDAKLAHLPDIPLEEGDRLYVPPRPAMVSVFGSVYYESSFLYRPDKRVEDYIAQAGGTTKRADSGYTFVVHADGSVSGSGGWTGGGVDGTDVMPGDTIVVPEDFEYRTWTAVLTDWARIFAQFGLGIAALKVLKDL